MTTNIRLTDRQLIDAIEDESYSFAFRLHPADERTIEIGRDFAERESRIEALAIEAREAGDSATVELCAKSQAGDPIATLRCLEALVDAEAMRDIAAAD